MTSRYLVGIDLGTTNCALSYVDTETPPLATKQFRFRQQGNAPSTATLSSSLFLTDENKWVAGSISVQHFISHPTRIITSAKSWLSYSTAKRKEKILPIESDQKLSPVEAATILLLHIKESWNQSMASALDEQEIILTIPASFDESARTLTLEAAKNAGLTQITLLEEPQAAFYHWLSRHEHQWQKQFSEGDVILVCDVGGGTTDFTLIEAMADGFQRIQVGRHLLLGGDNIDLAICHYIVEKLNNYELDLNQWQELHTQARAMKESLSVKKITLSGKGSKLVSGVIEIDISKKEIENIVIDGFFGVYSLDEALIHTKGSGLRTMGLPYESEASITKHLAAFLSKSSLKTPDFILFNGGTMKAVPFQKRIMHSIENWFCKPLKILTSDSLDLAVSKGAAYFGKVKKGHGIRVRGGSPRTYYLEVGDETRSTLYTLLPKGADEGVQFSTEPIFSLQPNTPVSFQLYSSWTRTNDLPGSLLTFSEEDMTPLPRLQTVLKFGKKRKERLPVKLTARLTEVGSLDLWLESNDTAWKLEFAIRDHTPVHDITYDRGTLQDACLILDDCFIAQNKQKLEILVPKLEAFFNLPRSEWPISVLRALFDQLLHHSAKRTLSAAHATRFWNLAGFFLRPGFGYALDEHRIKELWKLHLADYSPERADDIQVQKWIALRRVSAGLNKGQQTQVFASTFGAKFVKNSYIQSEKMAMLASFERIEPSQKIKLGESILAKLESETATPQDYWALGRVGARILLYGSVTSVIPPHVCEGWINRLLKNPPKNQTLMAFLLTLLAQKSDVKEINIPSQCFNQVRHFLNQDNLSDQVKLLLNERERTTQEASMQFGDALPPGIILLKNSDF